jgi:predicted glycogen debranching enzyme
MTDQTTCTPVSPSANPTTLLRRMPWPGTPDHDNVSLLTREWLVTNGLGGYASGTVSGVMTRRYHGLLVAALPAPFGRMVMLNHVAEHVKLPDGRKIALGGEERVGSGAGLHGAQYLREFRLESGLPVWRFDLGESILEKRLLLPHQQNTVHVGYSRIGGSGVLRLDLRPSLHFRHHEAPVSTSLDRSYVTTIVDDRYEFSLEALPPLRVLICGPAGTLTMQPHLVRQVLYRMEESRGYESAGDLWSPGFFRMYLEPGASTTLVASTESWDAIGALTPAQALDAETRRRERLIEDAPASSHQGLPAELVVAADQFIITPAGRVEDRARARAAGDEIRTIIAGYHWFTDWGRDTMISLEGLTLSTGRHTEAGYILRTFAHYVKDGLIPNMFPDGENEGLYHTADATLWFFHALHRYVERTGDRRTLALLLPILRDSVEHHLRGTRFGIGVDPADGLLRQGAEGYQLTWMDAKVDGWVVTPRRGKAVEINALWYNALRLLERWLIEQEESAPAARSESREQMAEAADAIAGHAARAYESFNRRFWCEQGGYLYDVVDGEHGDDPACRPNQVLAMSLDYPVLDPSRWNPVLDVVRDRLLTPVGLRSLAPGHPDYKPTYHGDLRTRDAAYHQGTVWAWLIGPMIDAWLRVHPDDRETARHMLDGFRHHLGEACIGSISEIFDAEDPYTPRGCVAQAWSVAEVLRCWQRVHE